MNCDYCKKLLKQELNELLMDGNDDVYNLTLCDECYELLSSDFYDLDQVDEWFM